MGLRMIKYDMNGNPFKKATFWLEPSEYAKINGEINNCYYGLYLNTEIFAHASFGIDGKAYIYWFENHGYNDYNCFMRVRDYH